MSSKKAQQAKQQTKKPTPKKEKPKFSPEKQEYIDRCNKRTLVRQKLEMARLSRKRKIGINYVPSDGEAPCAFMVEHVKKEVKVEEPIAKE